MISAPDCFIVDIFGREGRIVNSAENHVSVVYEGGPLSEAESSDLRLLLSYLCGNRAEFVSTETFGEGGRRDFLFHERGGLTERGLPPIRVDPWSAAQRVIPECFPAVLAGLGALRQKSPQGFAAVFHHYFEGVASSYSVTRILLLAIAIDSLMTLAKESSESSFIVSTETFSAVRGEVEKTLREALQAEGVSSKAVAQIVNRLDGLNAASPRQKQNEFWKRVGVEITLAEGEVLKTRHGVVHAGFVGQEESEEALWDNYWRSGVLANLLNRAVLRLIGWTGKYREATIHNGLKELDLSEPTLSRSESERINASPECDP